ncbi:phosphodiester glycosidase family protein [Ideonella sp. YS5]|uniref:phosphodiester glycosidase family protein n=1 Tax=Ideonella sp. YS5 TaxID=3453714 RepID=UPI003EED3583
MKPYIWVAAFAGLLASTVFAGPAFPPQRVEQLAAGQAVPAGMTRVRVSLAIEDATPDSQVQLGDLTVCSDKACYQSTTPPFVGLADTSKGTSTVIATFSVPYGRFRSVHLAPVAGPKTASGEISLTTPLKIAEGFYGGDIFVLLEKKIAQGTTTYVPTSAATGLYHDEGVSVYYNPKVALQKKLKFGTILTLPAGATELPQVFNVAAHDIGDDFPLVDIYPAIPLLKPGSLQVSAISRKAAPLLADEPPKSPRPQSASPQGVAARDAAVQSRTRTIELHKTGPVHSATAPSSLAEPDAAVALVTPAGVPTNAQGWTDCAAALNYPANQTIIANGLLPTGTEYLDWCTTIPPYIHIGISTLADPREVFSIRYSPEQFVNNATRLPLTRITDWSPNTQMMVNGFYWEGDYGLVSGQFGLAKGYLTDNKHVLGDNRTTGGSASKFPGSPNGIADNQKRVIFQGPSMGRDYYMDTSTPVGPYNYWAISSSTSIVRDGVCSTDGFLSRWSAVAITSYMPPRIVFVSSTSDGATTAAELCPVLKALGAYNALRLDGGPSAAFTMDGTLRNPLTNLDFLKFGRARYIAYGLKISYPGW